MFKYFNVKMLICLCVLSFLYFPVLQVSADGSMPEWKIPDLQISIPGLTGFSDPQICADDKTKMCIPWIGEYIAGIYKYAVGIVGILATVVLMWGGLIWLTAGGNAAHVTEAKTWIGASITGLVLVLCSYMILYEINPDLTRFSPIRMSWPAEEAKKKMSAEQALSSSDVRNIRQIAAKLIIYPRVTFSKKADCPNFHADKSINELASTGLSTACSPNCECIKQVSVDASLLIAIEDLLKNNVVDKIIVTSITTGIHGSTSYHYTGKAIDIVVASQYRDAVVKELNQKFYAMCDKGGDKVPCDEADHIHFRIN